MYSALRKKVFSSCCLAIVSSFGTTATLAFSQKTTAASKFKAPNAETPSDLASQWKQQDEALWAYVGEHVPDVLEHTGAAAFDEHLKGVQAVLRRWGAPTHITNAGLFHSIYGTEGFQGFSLPLSERAAIIDLIGEKAEKLCFMFCMVDRSTVDETVFAWEPSCTTDTYTFRARPEMGRFQIELNKEEWLDFIELTLADWLEQVEGAAETSSKLYLWKTGEAYAYRRLAYRKMSELLVAERPKRLSNVVPRMYAAVMGTESLSTRTLVQPRTPPQSEASAAALAALRAIGEAIPDDFSPLPVSSEVKPAVTG